MNELSEGDKVTWKSHGGEAVGEVKKKITSDIKAAKRQVRASDEDPQYLVKSDKSGGEAVHKPSALKKKDKKPGDDRDDVYRNFKQVVNMAPRELEGWLGTDASKSVGSVDGDRKSEPGDAESVGHDSGRRILQIEAKKKAELDDDDYDHMRKVVGYVHRHVAQKPEKERIDTSRWRYSLMNWGHDPLKE